MHNDLIVKGNHLIEGFMHMSQNEYKFTLHLISKIKKDDSNFRVQRVTVKEFSDLLEYKGQSLYEYMKTLEDSLLSKKIELNYSNGDRVKINWFSYTKYIESKGMLEIAFNNDLAPHLLQLDTNFTKYFLKNIKNLDSEYSIRIYEILKQYQPLKERIINLDKLKKMLGINPEQYKLYSNFKIRVLQIAQKQLKQNSDTDIEFNFEEVKTGRRVSAIKFIIQSKKIASANIDDELMKNQIDMFSHQELKLNIKNKLGIDISLTELNNLVEKHGKDKINYAIDNLYKILPLSAPKDKIFNYFRSSVMHGWDLSNKDVISRIHNFDERIYSDDYYEKFYSNVTKA